MMEQQGNFSQAGPADPGAEEAKDGRGFGWQDALRIAVVAGAAIVVRLHYGEPFWRVSILGILSVLVGGWPIFKEAAENLAARRMTMELSMSIAILAAAAISEFFTALLITLFVLVAEVLEDLTVCRGRRAIRDLLEFLPRTVNVRRAGAVHSTSVEELRRGDSVLVNPGTLVPVDGMVISGHSFVDQARITGESLPVEKLPGSSVYAGTINQSGVLEIRTEQIGRDTSYGKIIEAVESAERSQAPVQRMADRLAGYLVYFAIGAAVLTFVLTRDIRSTISVVIVAGACGIAAGTPLAILGAIGRAARLGAIIKGGLYLETLGRVDTVVLDKTGTLTLGRTEVQAIFPAAPDNSEHGLLESAASAEIRSEHPLGKAIVACARARGLSFHEPEEFDYTPGRGISAIVCSSKILVGNMALMADSGIDVPENLVEAAEEGSRVLVARDGRFLGTIVIGDTIRSEAKCGVKAFAHMGVQTVLLTGDSKAAANAVGQLLGIDQIEAEVLPEGKLGRIRELIESGHVVAMVGDGINDAPALTAASVGVAMGSGTDIARESGDVVLLGNDLFRFSQTLNIARWTRRIIWQNFVGTIAVDLFGIVLAALGVLNPTLAAFVHVASEMTFILNSARVLPRADSTRTYSKSGIDAEQEAIRRAA